MICSTKLNEFINETQSVDRTVRAVQYESERAEAERLAMKARWEKGKYANKEKRIQSYIDKSDRLKGKRISLEDVETGRFKEVKVRTAKPVGNNMVLVNNEFVVDMENNQTRDGMSLVEVLGSETTTSDNTTELETISGPLLAHLDEIVAKAKAVDENTVSKEHLAYLESLINVYRETLLAAGKDIKLTTKFVEDLDNVNNTRGIATPGENAEIELIRGNQRLNGMTEILAHELQHILIREVLKDNKELSTNILKLRDGLADEVDYTIFLKKGVSPTSEDINAAKARYDYVFNSDADVAADEFLAYATTNEQLMEKLGILEVPDTFMFMRKVKVDNNEKGLSKNLRNLWNKIIDVLNKVYKTKLSNGQSSREYALQLLDKALQLQYLDKIQQEKSIYGKVIEKIMNADKRVEAYTNGLRKANASYEETLKNENSKLNQISKAVWKIKGLARARSYVLQNNIFSSVTRNMGNKDIAEFYQMFRHTKAFVENAVAPMKQSTIDVLSKEYNFKEMAVEKRRAAKRVIIDTDAGVLGTAEDILYYLEDESRIDAKLSELSQDLGPEITKAYEALGELLVTNKLTMRNGYANAAQIQWDLGGINDNVEEQEKKIDIAATLVALKMSGKENKNLTIEAIKENSKGLNHILKLKKADEAEVLKQAYQNDKMYQIKGAKQEKYIGDKKHYIVSENEIQELAKAKFINLGKHEELSRILGKDMYIMAGTSLDVAYTEGLLSLVQLRNEGDSLRRLLMDINNMSEEDANDYIERFVDESNKNIDQALIPERSGLGEIYDYRVRIPHEAKSSYLGVEDDIVYTISETVANLTHKQEAMINNRASIIYFNRFYKNYKSDDSLNFIEISEESTGKFKEYWDIMPYYMKKQIKAMGGKFMIEESMLIDTFGYKDVSLINAPFIRNSKRKQVWAKNLEKVVHEIAQNWKQSVVAKMFDTIKGNMSSNALIAVQHMKDKDPRTYMVQFYKYWGHINDYRNWKQEKIKLELRQKAGEKISASSIKKLNTAMENSPVHVLMQDGQYTQIMEDLDSEWFTEKGILEEKLDAAIKLAETRKGTNPIKTIIDTLYIRKDSTLYESVMKLTLYSDAINKLIIMKALLDTDPEMTTQDRLNYVDQLHVNYAYLDNRWIKKANDTIIFSFTKYFFRVFPAMIKMMNKKAVSIFLTESAQGITGIDVENPLDQFYNPFTSIFRKMSAWTDIENIFSMLFTPAIAR